MKEQELLAYLQKDEVMMYLFNRDLGVLCNVSVLHSNILEHSLEDVINLTKHVIEKLQVLGKEEMVEDMYHLILFSGDHVRALSSDQISHSLDTFENFVQALGFLLYGYNLSPDQPDFYNGDNLPNLPMNINIKTSHLNMLIKGEIGNPSQTIKLPLLDKKKYPFVNYDNLLFKELINTIVLFRGNIVHHVAIRYENIALYNIGNSSSEYIRRDLILSALLMVDYHYELFDKLINPYRYEIVL